MKYVNVKVFRDMPKDEKEYSQMKELMPNMLKKLYETCNYTLTYLIEDEIVAGDVYIAPYGKRSKIVVIECEADASTIKSDINYRPLLRKIDNLFD